MAKKKKPRGKPFEIKHKKSVGNKGKTTASYDREELASRKVDHNLLSRYFTLNSHLTEDELRERLESGERITILEKRIILALLGDRDADLDFIFNRMAGKVPDVVRHGKEDPFSNMSIEELIQRKRELEDSNRQTLKYIEAEQERQRQIESAAIDITPNSKPKDDLPN